MAEAKEEVVEVEVVEGEVEEVEVEAVEAVEAVSSWDRRLAAESTPFPASGTGSSPRV